MNIRFLFLPAVALSLFFNSCEKGAKKVDLKDGVDSLSYCIGLSIGESIVKSELPQLDIEITKAAMLHVLDSSNSQQIEAIEAEAFMQEYMTQLGAKAAAQRKLDGERFLAENATKEGVITTVSGLQYKIIQEGTGPKAKLTDKVKVHYHGTLMDNTVFDSSIDRGEPAEFRLNQVIPGWGEALQLMNVGSKYMIYIPHQLGYGEHGAGGSVPPYSTLVFEVELLGIDSTATEEGAK